MTRMKVIGIAGWSGAGKTTLLTRVIPLLTARGLRVSTIKHAHHAFDVDQPGKDSHTHRMAGATEVLISSANRFALMHELRGAPEMTLHALLDKLSPVDLVLVEGFKREAHPKLEVYRAAVGKPLLHPDDPNIVAIASDGAGRGARAGGLARRYRGGRGHPRRQGGAARCGARAGAERLMAQLSDDCFAFGGPLLAIDDVERLIAERVTPVAETETVALKDARGRVLAADVVAPIDLPPFDNSAVDGYAVRHADLGQGRNQARDRRPPDRGPRGGARRSAPARRSASSPARRCRRAPTRCSCRRTCASRTRAVIVPPGLKRGANRRLAGEDVARGSVALRAGRRLQPQDLSMAAALGLQTLAGAAARARRDLLDRRRDRRAGRAAAGRRALRREPRTAARTAGAARRRGERSRHPARRSRTSLPRGSTEAAQGHDLVLTSGGVSTGEADYVRDAIEAVGTLVFWRVAIKPGRPVAMGVLRGTAFVGLPGNPVAVFVTFARVVRPLLLRLARRGARAADRAAGRVGLCVSQEEGPARICARVADAAGGWRYVATKHPQDGAGVISSLTATDGLAELADDVTEIAPGTDDRLPAVLGAGGLDFLRSCRELRRPLDILRRVHVEERIDRLGRPVGERDAVARGPHLDLAQVLDRDGVAQILAQRDLPQPDHRMAPVARMRAGERLVLRRCAPHAAAPPDRAAGTGSRPAR